MLRRILGPLARRLGFSPPVAERRAFLLKLLPQRAIGAEIGVHLGDFSQQLLDALSPTELHLVDPWMHEAGDAYRNAWFGGQAAGGQAEMDARHAQVCARFARQIGTGQVAVHRGASVEVLSRFEDGHFDWIYIDGNHLYDFVKADLALALRKTRAGGLVTGDDYGGSGWWRDGVTKAVDEFAADPGVRLLEIRHGQYVFRRL